MSATDATSPETPGQPPPEREAQESDVREVPAGAGAEGQGPHVGGRDRPGCLGRLLRVVLAGLILLVLFVALSFAALTQTDPGRALLLQQVLRVVNDGEVLLGTLEIERLRGPLVGHLGVDGIAVRDRNGRALVRLDTLDVSWRLRPLLRGRIVVDDIALSGLVVDTRITEDGTLDLLGLVPPSDAPDEPGGGIDMRLERVHLADGRIVLRDARNQDARLIDLTDFGFELSVVMTEAGRIRVEVGRLAADALIPGVLTDPVRLTLRSLELDLVDAFVSVAVDSIGAGETAVRRLAGAIHLDETGERPFHHLDIGAPLIVLDPQEVNDLVGEPVLRHPLALELGIRGPADATRLQLRLDAGDEQTVDAELTLDLTDPADPAWRLWLSLARLQPHRWLDVSPFLDDAPTADISLALRAEGRGITPDGATARVVLEVGPSRVGDLGVDGVFLSASWADRRLSLGNLEASGEGIFLEAAGDVSLDGRVHVGTRIRIDELAEPISLVPDMPALTGGLSIDLRAEGTIPLDPSEAPGTEDPVVYAMHWIEGLDFDLDATLQRIALDDMRLGRARIVARGIPRDPPVITLRIDARDGRIGTTRLDQLTLDWRSVGMDGTLSLDASVDRGAVRASLQSRLGWDAGTVAGTLSRLEAEASGVAASLGAPATFSVVLDDAFAPVSARADVPSLQALGAEVRLGGQWAASGAVSGSLAVEGFRLQAIAPLVEGFPAGLDGGLALAAELGGTLRKPTLRATMSLREGRFEDLRQVELDARLDHDGETAKFGAHLRTRDVTLTEVNGRLPFALNLETGAWDVPSRVPFDVRMRTDALDVRMLAGLAGDFDALDLAGTLEGDLTVGGTLRDPQVQGRMSVLGLGVTLALDELGVAPWRVSPVDFAVEGVYGMGEARGVNGSVSLHWPERPGRDEEPLFAATVKLDADLRDLIDDPDNLEAWVRGLRGLVTARLARFNLRRLPADLREAFGLLDGVIEGEVGWAGSIEAGHARGAFSATDLEFDGAPPVDIAATIDVAEEVMARVDVAALGRPMVSLELGMDDGYQGILRRGLRLSSAIRGRLELHEMRVSDLDGSAAELGAEPGVLRGYVDLFGTLEAPELFGRLALRELLLFDERESLIGVEIAYAQERFTVHVLMCDGAGDAVDLRASLGVPLRVAGLLEGEPMPPLDTWPVEASLRMARTDLVALTPRALVAGLIEDIAGWIDAELTVSGTVGDPRVAGSLGLHEASLSVIPLARSFDEISMQASFGNEFVRVEELLVRDGAGRIEGTAEVALVDYFPEAMRLEFDLRDFLLSDPSGAGVFLGGRVEVDGITRDGRLVIDTALIDMRVDVPDDAAGQAGLGPTQLPVPVLFVGETVAADQVGQRHPRGLGEEEELVLTDLDIDVRVRTRGRNEVRHSLATIQFAVNLDLEIRGEDITAAGHVGLPSGEIRVAGRRLDIERGRINFSGTGDDAFNPSLDIRAVHVLSSGVAANLEAPSGERATITVVVSGTANNPEIGLQSDPPMSEEDIVFVLLTGRPRMDDGDADAQSQVLATAGSLALGLLSDRISGDIPIDTLRIEGDAQEGQAISRVEGGKYIRENLYLSGTFIPGAREDENNFEIGLEWILLRFGSGSVRLHVRGGNAQKGSTEILYNFVVP